MDKWEKDTVKATTGIALGVVQKQMKSADVQTAIQAIYAYIELLKWMN